MALQPLALPPRSQPGPGARHCNALGASLSLLLQQERLLSHHPAATRPLEGRGQAPHGEQEPYLKFGAATKNCCN